MKIVDKQDIIDYKYKGILPESLFRLFADRYIAYKYAKVDVAFRGKVEESICANRDNVLPDWVEIETRSRCNGTCEFCPVHAGADPRPDITMSDHLYRKIVDDFAAHDYRGAFALFCNNEPFKDPSLLDRVEYAKKMLPHAYHYLYTNGTLLTPDKFTRLMRSLDILIIDNYNKNGEMNRPIMRLYNEFKDQYSNAYIWMRRPDEVYCTRGGHAPNRDRIRPFKSGCVLPFRHMYIRPDGKVSLCCQDAIWSAPVLGDLYAQNVNDVWNGKPYRALRQHFIDGRGRAGVPVCDQCDFMSTGKNFELFTGDDKR